MKRDLIFLIMHYVANVGNTKSAEEVERWLLPHTGRDKGKNAVALRRAVSIGEVLGEVGASTVDDNYMRFYDSMAAPEMAHMLKGLKLSNGKGEYVPLPLNDDMIGELSGALGSYLTPLLTLAWEHAYMKGRMEEWERMEEEEEDPAKVSG